MLYSENAKIIYRRLTISVTDMKPRVRQNHFGTSRKIGLVYFRVNKNSKEAFFG